MAKDQASLEQDHLELFKQANKKELEKKETNKARGRNKISAKLRRKQKNVVDASNLKLKEKLKQKGDQTESNIDPKEVTKLMRERHGALQRFITKPISR